LVTFGFMGLIRFREHVVCAASPLPDCRLSHT
jgi:hypothetical protein